MRWREHLCLDQVVYMNLTYPSVSCICRRSCILKSAISPWNFETVRLSHIQISFATYIMKLQMMKRKEVKRRKNRVKKWRLDKKKKGEEIKEEEEEEKKMFWKLSCDKQEQ